MVDGRRARGQASRDAMLAAAVSIVARGGMAELTHRAVASAAQVSPALVAYHFTTAAELRRATLLYAGSRLTAVLTGLLAAAPEPEAVPRVAADLAVAMVTSMRDEAVTICELVAAAARDPELRPAMTALIGSVQELIAPRAATTDSDGRALAGISSGAFLGTVLSAMALGQDADLNALRHQIVHLVRRFDPRQDGPIGE